MKNGLYITLLLALAGFTRWSSAGGIPPLARSQKIITWAQAKDPRIAQGIEFDLQGLLADRQMVSERYSKLFPPASEAAPRHRLEKMRQLSMDALMVLQPEENIQWPERKPSSEGSALEWFLTTPPGDLHSVAVAPTDVMREQAPGVAVAERGPISGNQGPDAQQVIKVGAIVFDVATGDLIWKGKFPVRASPDLPTVRFQKLIAQKAIETLSNEGLLPAVR